MGIKRAQNSSSYQYTVSYSDMGGVNFSPCGRVDRGHFAHLENMYRDYTSGGALESIPGFRRIAVTGKKINGLFRQKSATGTDYVIIHAGDSLYRFAISERDELSPLTPIATVRDVRSSAFTVGADVYILDGEKIILIDGYGRVGTVGDEDHPTYIPTTYVNGSPYQPMNLLSDEFRESFLIASSEENCYGTDDLKYLITDEENKLCSAVGVSASYSGSLLHIPSCVVIGGEKYRVTEIADSAFVYNKNIYGVVISEGIRKIGRSAFCGCSSLTDVQTPTTLVEIATKAFQYCTSLSTFYLSSGVRVIGIDAFKECTALTKLNYALSESEFATISGASALSEFTVEPYKKSEVCKVRIPINTPASKINEIKFNGKKHTTYSIEREDNICKAVILSGNGIGCFDGVRLEIYGTIDEEYVKFSSEDMGLINPLYSGTGRDVVYGCTVCESFDGRIFLSGNPSLPNTVIYSEKDDTGLASPLYFGIYNYFNDGCGNYPVKSMLSVADALLVFKEDDDGQGSVFYHTARDTGLNILPRIYPTSYTHNGIGALGRSISFLDDPIFISKNGVMSLATRAINLERSIVCRSRNINAKLCREELDSSELAVWCGYLCLLTNGRIYLADSRALTRTDSGEVGYEWYYLTDIGTYSGDKRVFRYSSKASSADYSVHKEQDRPTPENCEVKFDMTANGYVYYIEKDGKKYEVYPTLEFRGGNFNPATTLLSVDGELLFFGCSNGDVCIFNNDKRGIAPKHLTQDVNFSYEEYASVYGGRIHPYYYDFNTHAARYVLKTPIDNGNIPNMAKNTVKHSLTLKCRIGGVGGGVKLDVCTDRGGYRENSYIPNAVIDFSDIDFSSMVLSGYGDITLPLSEREKGWTEKQITLTLEDYQTPFIFHQLSYLFKIKGRIKPER